MGGWVKAGKALFRHALLCVDPAEKLQALVSAAELFAMAHGLEPGALPPLLELVRCLTAQSAAAGNPLEKRRLLADACAHHAAAFQIDPRHDANLGYWGRTLNQLARLSEGEERIDLHRQAAEKQAAAALLSPGDFYHPLFEGYSLLSLAKLVERPMQAALFRETAERFAAADTLADSGAKHGSALGYEGIALLELGELTEEETERIELYRQAAERLGRATSLNPESAHFLHVLGRALLRLGRTATEEERRDLLAKIAEAFGAAVRLEPLTYVYLRDWTWALRKQADACEPPERIDRYRENVRRLARSAAEQRSDDLFSGLWSAELEHLTGLLEEREQLEEIQRQAEFFADAMEPERSGAAWSRECAKALMEMARLLGDGALKGAVLEAAKPYTAAAVQAEPRSAAANALHAHVLTDLASGVAMPGKVDLYRQAIACYAVVAELTPDDADNLADWGGALWNLGRELKGEERAEAAREAKQRFAAAAALKPDNGNAFHHWGFILSHLADNATRAEEMQALNLEALEKLEIAIRLEPERMLSHYYAGTVFSNLALHEEDPAREEKYYLSSSESFRKAVELDPGWATAHAKLGNRLSDLAEFEKNLEGKMRLYREAEQCYATAITLSPGEAWHFNNWGLVLYDRAHETPEVEEQMKLLRAATEKFTTALELEPGRSGTRHSLANTLAKRADLAPKEERPGLYDQALSCYAAALSESRRKHAVLRHWANTLCEKAKLLEDGPEEIALLREADGLYAQAAGSAPEEDSAIHFNWGSCLLQLSFASPRKDPEQVPLLARAVEHFAAALRLSPQEGDAAFHAALCYGCQASYLGDDAPEKARALRRAVRYCEIAARLSPSDASNFCWWGRQLWRLAEMSGRTPLSFAAGERQRLLIQSSRRFATGLRLDPQDSQEWIHWAETLLTLAEDHFDMGERANLHRRARLRCRRAIKLDKKAADAWFMLARVEAGASDAEAAVEALERWRKAARKARRQRIENCSDFHNLQGNPSFEAFLRSWD